MKEFLLGTAPSDDADPDFFSSVHGFHPFLGQSALLRGSSSFSLKDTDLNNTEHRPFQILWEVERRV
jgi:hypothetical protein